MPSQQPGSRLTSENVYRVYRMPDAVREAIGSRAAGQTIRQFIAEVVEHRLPPLVATLAGAGIAKPDKPRPARLPMTRQLLQNLAAASEQTGVPATRLLLAILSAPATPVGRKQKPAAVPKNKQKRGKRSEAPKAAPAPKKGRQRRSNPS